MIVKHKINSFLFDLFSVEENDLQKLIDAITQFYRDNNIVPTIEVSENFITIALDFSSHIIDSEKYNKLISLCESREFEEAYDISLELCKKYNDDSDLHRIKGQIETELGFIDKAINSLIDALRWNPQNVYALIMMGNIFARNKEDVETAMKYFNEASTIDPNDNISLNNIGANLMSVEKFEEAKVYLKKAETINPNYPNTKYALAYISFKKLEYHTAFELALKSLILTKSGDEIFNNSISLINAISEAVSKSDFAYEKLKAFISHIEEICGKKVRIEVDNEIPTIAKVEYAEIYNRDYHLVKYKSGYPSSLHLILHELIHIELASEARIADCNMLFTSSEEHRIKFITNFKTYSNNLRKKGYSEKSISNLINSLFEGLNRQVFNTPIDLFIEDRIHNKFPEFHAIQFISLLAILNESIDAVTRKEIIEIIDDEIVSKSKIYNLVNAIHFKNIFGLDYRKRLKASSIELKSAEKLYNEFVEYREDKQPAEEYELVQNWGDDLKLGQYFKLVSEEHFDKKNITNKNLDIYDYPDDDTDANQQIDMHEFVENHTDKELNSAVMMYMVGALKYFEGRTGDEIKNTAFEIATIGMNGINPNNESGYTIPSITGSNFSGYQLLAYYYVSWALSSPQLLPELRLPFDKEYESAKSFSKL